MKEFNQQLKQLRKRQKEEIESSSAINKEIIAELEKAIEDKRQELDELEKAQETLIKYDLDDVDIEQKIRSIKEEINHYISEIESQKQQINQIKNRKKREERQWVKDFAFQLFIQVDLNEDWENAVCPFVTKTLKKWFQQGWKEAERNAGYSIPFNFV